MPLLLCPNCNTSTQGVERSGVQFDMCPACRGVWLDRGELEKLMAAAQAEAAPFAYPRDPNYAPASPTPSREWRGRDDDDRYDREPQVQGRRKRGFDLFDIFD